MDSCVILKYITLGHVADGAQWTKVHLVIQLHAGTPQRPSTTGPTEGGCVLHTL